MNGMGKTHNKSLNRTVRGSVALVAESTVGGRLAQTLGKSVTFTGGGRLL